MFRKRAHLLATPFVGTFVAFLPAWQASAASEWVYLTSSDSGSKYFYDASSIAVSGNSAQIWIRGDHGSDRTKSFHESKSLWKFNCIEKTTVTLLQVTYSRSGTVLNSSRNPDIDVMYEPVIPDSIADAAMEKACGQ